MYCTAARIWQAQNIDELHAARDKQPVVIVITKTVVLWHAAQGTALVFQPKKPCGG
jgi:hypothetical protein